MRLWRWASGRIIGRSPALLAATLAAAGVTGTVAAIRPVLGAAAPVACSRTAALAYSAAAESGARANIWVANADGSDRRKLFTAATPVLSPDGTMVAVTKLGSSGALGIFTVCGGEVRHFFSSHDTVSEVTWSPDGSTVAAVVAADPETAPFREHLELIDVASGAVTTVATGFLDGFGGPTFSPGPSHELAYPEVTHVDGGENLWSFTPGGSPVQLTTHGTNQYPLWGPQGLLYQHANANGRTYLQLIANDGHTSTLMKLADWPVAISSDGTHLAAEGAACGVVYPVSVDLTTRKVVHQFPASYAPDGISPAGDTMLISGYTPKDDCGGPRSRIETVPFSGGPPTFIAFGTDPSWADSQAVGVQP